MNSGKSESVVCENQNRAKLIDQNGNEIADNILIYRSRNLTGMYVQSVDQGNEEVLLRMIDSKGNDLSGLCFSIGYFNGRYFWVKRDGKYAMIDKQGVVLSKWYDELLMNYTSGDYNWELDGIIQFYHDQTIPFRLGEKWGYIDFEGKEIYGASFSKAYHFRSGKAVAFQDEKPVLLDKTGNIVPLDHDSIYEFSRWVYIAEKGGKFGFISTEGKPVGEFVYDKIEIIPDWYNTQDFEMICGYGILGDKKIALDYFGKEVDGK
ncbi:MAG: WG repeat-containing protein, partial [Bacteroidetes bacterium]|nr:WG repeat-containing protein [Bacteroidota bacterium]